MDKRSAGIGLTMGAIVTIFLMTWLLGLSFLYWYETEGDIGNFSKATRYGTPFLQMAQTQGCYAGLNGTGLEQCTGTNSSTITADSMFNSIKTTIGLSAIAGVAAFMVFPNMWAIFAASTAVMLTSLTFPLGLINNAGLPFPITFALMATYGFALMGLLAWFKGGDLP